MANWKRLESWAMVISHWLLGTALGGMTSEYSCLATCRSLSYFQNGHREWASVGGHVSTLEIGKQSHCKLPTYLSYVIRALSPFKQPRGDSHDCVPLFTRHIYCKVLIEQRQIGTISLLLMFVAAVKPVRHYTAQETHSLGRRCPLCFLE